MTANRPINTIPEISDEVRNYNSEERRRLCIVRHGDRWVVELATPEEANSWSWYYRTHGVASLALRGYTTLEAEVRRYAPIGAFVGRRAARRPERVLLDAHIRREGRGFITTVRVPTTSFAAIAILGERIGRHISAYETLEHESMADASDSVLSTITHLERGTPIFTHEAVALLGNGRGHNRRNMNFEESEAQLRQVLDEEPREEQLRLEIDLGALEDNPSEILQTVNNAFQAQNQEGRHFTKLFVIYENPVDETHTTRTRNPGIDEGGLSRDFVSKIFRSVVNEKNTLPGFEFVNGTAGVIPVANTYNEEGEAVMTDEAIVNLRTMGRLMGICFENPRLLTGEIFDPIVFGAIASLTIQEAMYLIDHEPTPEINRKLFTALNPNITRGLQPEDLSDEDLVATLFGIFPDGVPEDPFGDGTDAAVIKRNLQAYVAGVNAHISQFSQADARVLATTNLIKGMAEQIGADRWNQISEQEPATLQQTIQGQLTKDLFLNQVTSNISNARIQDFLVRWTRENSLERVSQFIWAQTGSYSLGTTNLRFNVNPADAASLPVFHTCFHSVDFSVPDTYAEFSRKLDLAIDNSMKTKGMDIG